MVSVAAGASHSLAVLNDGSVWGWGDGSSGQLGNGQSRNSIVPLAVSAPAAWVGQNVLAVSAGGAHTLAIVGAPNQPPVAGDDSYSVAEDTMLTVAAPGVLANDSDPESGALTIAPATPPAHGALTLRTDGSFDYTPAANYHGGDSFTYTVSDSGGLTATATVNLTVTPVNDPPQITSQHVSTPEDSALAVILGATDLDGDAVTLSVISAPAHGTVSGTPPELTYTPHANYHGSDSFSFLANDGHGGIESATVFITVNPANDLPLASAQSVTTAEDTVAAITLAGSDVDGDALTFAVVNGPAHGTLSGTAPNLTYRPFFGYAGPDQFSFRVNDGTADSEVATVSITVTPVNDFPEAFAQSVVTSEDTATTITLGASDPEAGGYTVLHTLTGNDGRESYGQLIEGDGGFLYGTTRLGGASGRGVVFRVAKDGTGYTVLRAFAGADGDQPNSGLTRGSDGLLYGTTVQGGAGLEGVVYRLATDGSQFEVIRQFTFPGGGARGPFAGVREGADGLLYGTTRSGGFGSVGTIYRLRRDGSDFTVLHALPADGSQGSYLTAGLVEGSANQWFGVAEAGGTAGAGVVFRVNHDGSGYIVLHHFGANAGDGQSPVGDLMVGPDGALYGTTSFGGDSGKGTVFKINPDGTDYTLLRAFTTTYVDAYHPERGTLTLGPDGMLYGTTRSSGNFGAVYRISPSGSHYELLHDAQINNGDGIQSRTGVHVDLNGHVYGITSRGDPTDQGVLFRLNPAAGGIVSYLVTAQPQHGTLAGTPPNLVYTPAANYSGTDRFTFQVSDGSLSSAVQVNITVLPVNDLPMAGAESVITAEETPLAITLAGSDAEGNSLSYVVATAPVHGTLSGTAPNLTYTPSANYNGPDSFTFTVNDGTVTSSAATVMITVTPVNDAPVAVDDDYETNEDTVLTISSPGMLANDTDADEGPLVKFRFKGQMTTTDGDFTNGDQFEGFYTINPATAGVSDLDSTTTLQFDSRNVAWQFYFPATGYRFNGDWTELSVGNNTLFGDRYIASLLNGSSVGAALPSGRQLSFAQLDLQDRTSEGADFLHDDSIQTTTIDLASTSVANGRFRFEDNSQPWMIVDELRGPQSVTAVTELAANVNSLITLPSGASLRVNRNGSFSYDPRGRFDPLPTGGTATDSFTYEVSDPDGGSATATVSITIHGVDDLPAAIAQSVTTAEDTALAIALTGSDAEGSALSYTVVDGPTHGTLSGTAPNLTYAPAANYHGPDSFTFTVNDGTANSAPATVSITVTPVNDLPSADGQSLTTYDNSTLAITLAGADIETSPLTYRIVSGPTQGLLSGTPPNVIYTPPFPFAGNASFTFEVEDADGATASAAVAITILASDRPPVAAAGADQSVVAGTDCLATVTVDGGASSDADDDALGFTWQLLLNGEVMDTVTGEAAVSWSLPHGTYEAVLTVSTDKNGTLVSRSDSLVIEVRPSVPVLAALTPAGAYAGGPGFDLTVTGGCFLSGAVVHWNGQPQTTTVVGSGELVATISASDLLTGVNIAVAAVQVINGDGQVSNPLGFSIVAQTVGMADAAVTQPGETSTVSTAPATAGEPGVTVTVQNGGDQPVTVLAASYDERPVGETAFQVDNGSFVDVQITGADEHTAATVFFYYPSTTAGGMENRVKLRYFDGANWMEVFSSRRLPDGSISETPVLPVKDIRDNLDGTVSGGRFAVVFDATSTPTIMALTGTVFGMIESEPQLQPVTGPTGPVALGEEISVTVDFAVVGDPAAATVRFLWDDGTEAIVPGEAAGSVTAAHLYAAPGVHGVTVQVMDASGDVSEGRLEYVVIYDPNGGFVTGGGWIDSPAGAYVYDATLTGRATFGFNSKYLKGQSLPTGHTQFQFQAGDFKFHSTAYKWLVVSGAKAQYKGVGQVNGAGDYGFLLTATDGQLNGGGDFDKFRIKIWDRASNTVVYDNRRGTSDDVDNSDPQAIGGGSIVIHNAK